MRFSYYTEHPAGSDYASTVQGNLTVPRPIRRQISASERRSGRRKSQRRRRARGAPRPRLPRGDGGYLDLGRDPGQPRRGPARLLGRTPPATRSSRCASATCAPARDLPDVVARSYYGGAWSADSPWFFYTVHDEAYRPHEVWRHRLGTPVEDDVLVLDEPDERFELTVRAEPQRGRSCWSSARAATPARSGWSTPRGAGRASPARSAAGGPGWSTAPSTCAARAPGELLAGDQRRRRRVPAGPVPGAAATPTRTTPPGSEVRPEDPAERLERVDAFAGHVVLSCAPATSTGCGVVPADDLAGAGVVLVAAASPAATVRLARNTAYDARAVTVVDESLRRARRCGPTWTWPPASRHRRAPAGGARPRPGGATSPSG